MSGPEAKIERGACAWARLQGCLTLKVRHVENGYPDRVIIGPKGDHLWLEFKAPGKKPTRLQARRLRDLNENGAHATWVNSLDFAKQLILKYCLIPIMTSTSSKPSGKAKSKATTTATTRRGRPLTVLPRGVKASK